jgi:hypothetical protein
MFTNLSQDQRKQRFDLGSYIGIVVDNNDPLHMQRIRVRIHEIHRGLADKEIPWAIRQCPAMQGMGGGISNVGVPALYTKVEVRFMDDSINYPKYVGSLSNSTDLVNAEFLTHYPNVYGFTDAAGNIFKVDTTSGSETVNFTHKSGLTISISSEGNCSINANDVSIMANGKMNLGSTGDLHISSKGTLYFDATAVQSNSGSPASQTALVPRNRPSPASMSNKEDY